ncbi:short-chain dehydrogenase [Stemphylium lycopersici]|uniref:Short-chain dehydrogenase n=1 Tax=Stemphylium lycopersici TaxID=183478 RepID=A0A364NAU0_STELY|nr:aflatoxin biosynthesis ketoreductase nor-1 [Stemphylium lycopersici]RAR09497.1 short-chain dehydrogenase [Stemphylium lycopersici]RAR14293.1 short-chain dehydrogenase [Stemphylium lycopersici]
MSPTMTYLITGANRGIGKGLTSTLLQRPNTTVVAAVRDVAKSTSTLEVLAKASGSKLIIVKLDSSSEADPKNAVAQLQSEHGITSLDIVIANAGIAHSGSTIVTTSSEALRDHFAVNTIGPILLFQAVKPLLQASKSGNPIFLAISTVIGSMGAQAALASFPQVFSPYGASKAALNWAVARLHFEETWATSYVTHPGLVMTDMGSAMASPEELKAAGAITVEESVNGVLSTLDKADRTISGTFQNYDGTTLPW